MKRRMGIWLVMMAGMLVLGHAAVLYALSTPVSKHLLQTVAPTMAAAFHFVCGQNQRNRLGMMPGV